MNSSMLKLLKTESVGGNAGRVKLDGKYYSCAAANGYADPQGLAAVALRGFRWARACLVIWLGYFTR